MPVWGQRHELRDEKKKLYLGFITLACIAITIITGAEASSKAAAPKKRDCRYNAMMNHKVRSLHRGKLENMSFTIPNPYNTSVPPYRFKLTKGRFTVRCPEEELGYSKCCGFECTVEDEREYCFLRTEGSYATYVGKAWGPPHFTESFSVVLFLVDPLEDNDPRGLFVVWENSADKDTFYTMATSLEADTITYPHIMTLDMFEGNYDLAEYVWTAFNETVAERAVPNIIKIMESEYQKIIALVLKAP